MKPFIVPTKEQVGEKAQLQFDRFTGLMGKMPNLYATIGYSENQLDAYLAYTQAQAKGYFHARDREAIYLIVSQFNGCEYCLASHTQSAVKAGWKIEDTIRLRQGTYDLGHWVLLYKVIQSVIDNRGEVSDALLDEFYASGYDNAAIIDLMALINVMSFTNYVYRLIKVPIDFPAAPALIDR